MVLEVALQLKLLHAGLDDPHHFTVGCTADLVHVAQHCHLLGGLDHTAARGERGGGARGNGKMQYYYMYMCTLKENCRLKITFCEYQITCTPSNY